MAQLRTRLRIFTAGPSDVAKELDVVRRVVEELNRGIADDKGLILECVGWRTHVAPGMGRPQDVILRQIEPEDIFVGVMWSRVGTPTGMAESGTVEEFELAYRLWQDSGGEERGRPQVLFYMSEKPVRVTNTDQVKQLEALLRFTDSVVERGLVARYKGVADFEAKVRQHLTTIVRRWRGRIDRPVTGASLRQLADSGLLRVETAIVVVADIEGFQLLNLELGTEACDRICDEYQARAERRIVNGGGAVLRSEGDHVWALFGDPVRAAEASVALLREIRAFPEYQDLPVRICLHRPTEWNSTSDVKTIYTQARLATALAKLSHGGHIVATGEFKARFHDELARDGRLAMRPVGWHRHGWVHVADMSRRVDVWELLDVEIGAAPRSLRVPMSSDVSLGRLLES